MMLVREEGWKEVKVVAISAVRAQPAERVPDPPNPAAGTPTPWSPCPITVTKPACGTPIRWPVSVCRRAGGAAWTIVPNAVRSTMALCGSSASLTRTSPAYPKSSTGRMRLSISGRSPTPYRANGRRRQAGSNTQLDALWNGQVAEVVQTLDQLDLEQGPIHARP